jgi:hypothetical protein
LDSHRNSFEYAGDLGHAVNHREQSGLDFETAEKSVIEWLKKSKTGLSVDRVFGGQALRISLKRL